MNRQDNSPKYHKYWWLLGIFVLTTAWVIGFGLLSNTVTSVDTHNTNDNPSIYFPSIQQIIAYHGDRLVSGPMFMCMGGVVVGVLFIVFRSVKNILKDVTLETLHIPILLLLGIGALGMGSIHFIAAYGDVAADLLLRVDLTQVTEITVERLDKRGECSKLTINDKAILAEGLNQLTKAHQVMGVDRVFFWKKGGYLIYLKVPGAILHYRYLLVYKYRGDGKQVQAVTPVLSPPTSSPHQAFRSPEFHEWIAEEIDPHFENCPLE